ncbi:MAG: sphingosine kinase, partial [Pseudomonadota bacterium]
EIEKAVETIIAGATTRIDVGKVNDRIFLNNASLGLYPRIVRQREILQRQGWGKWLAFVRASLSTIARYAPLRAQLKTERHGDINQKTPFVFIGNNEYLIEGSNLGQRKRLDAGSLWVYRATQTTRLQLLWLFVAQVSGMGRGRQLKVFDTRQLQIEAPEPYLEIGLDGEVVRLATPLAIEILPSALQVVIPATAD